MKNKNLPRKQKPKKRQSKNKKDNFNPWITKYFDLSGCGIEKCNKTKEEK